jgi:hypothetical protein
MGLTAKSVSSFRDWAKDNGSKLRLLGTPILFWNPENGSGDDSRVWWRIPVSLHPHLWNWQWVDDCSVRLVILRSGSVQEEHEMCWQTSEGPRRVANLEPNTIYSVPVVIRSVRGESDPVVAGANRGIYFSLPTHSPIVTNADVMLERKIPTTSLSNKDYVMQLEIRRQGSVIKKSQLYVLHVPPSSQDNRHFSLHLRSVPEFKITHHRQLAQFEART